MLLIGLYHSLEGAVPIPSISCCVSKQLTFFYKQKKALAFDWERCCHLVLCLQLIIFHWALLLTRGRYKSQVQLSAFLDNLNFFYEEKAPEVDLSNNLSRT